MDVFVLTSHLDMTSGKAVFHLYCTEHQARNSTVGPLFPTIKQIPTLVIGKARRVNSYTSREPTILLQAHILCVPEIPSSWHKHLKSPKPVWGLVFKNRFPSLK